MLCCESDWGQIHLTKAGTGFLTGSGSVPKNGTRALTSKRRVRSTRGARGSNPSQKTPRQRGEFISSRTKRALSTRVTSYSKRTSNSMDAHGLPRAMRLCFLKGRTHATNLLCMMTGAKHRVRSTRGARGSNPSQKTPRQRSARSALSTRVARSLLFKSAFRRNAQADS